MSKGDRRAASLLVLLEDGPFDSRLDLNVNFEMAMGLRKEQDAIEICHSKETHKTLSTRMHSPNMFQVYID